MTRLTPHVLFALRRAHGHAVRNLDEARDDAVRTRDRAEEARRIVAERTAEEAELRAALDAHIDATTAQDAERAREPRIAGVLVGPGVDPQEAQALADTINAPTRDAISAATPADTRRTRASWEH